MWKTALIFPDIHAPYHHKKAVANILKLSKQIKIDEIYFLGDLADFYFCNLHGPKHPHTIQTAKEEMAGVNEFLDQIDKAFPKQVKHYIEGNHEYRLERWLIAKAPELFGVTDWQLLLGMDTRKNWKVYPYNYKQLVSILGTTLYARHEPRAMTSPKASGAKSGINLVYGHVHRIESYTARSQDGKKRVQFSCGWLGDMRFDKIFGYVKSIPDWSLGFSIVYGNTKTKQFSYTTHHIEPDGSFNFMGKHYT